jgi:hypothetical protein
MSAAAELRIEGLGALRAGDARRAIPLFQQVVQLEPTDAEALAYLGVAHAQVGEYGPAVEALTRAAELRPEDAATRYNLALACQKAGRFEDARREATAALKRDPSHQGATSLLAALPVSTAPEPQPAAAPHPPAIELGDFIAAPAPPSPGAVPTPPSGLGAYTTPLSVAGPGALVGATVTEAPAGRAPGLGRRVLRGWLWGMILGQWWTLWTVVSGLLWEQTFNPLYVAQALVFFAFFGSLTGIVIGLANVTAGAGWIGVGAGMTMLAIEAALGAFHIINVFWYFFTGQWVGAGLARRIHAPID